jgi:hypothetical protein
MYEVLISDDEDSLPAVPMPPLFTNNTGNMLRELDDAQDNATIALRKDRVAANIKSGQEVADGQG